MKFLNSILVASVNVASFVFSCTGEIRRLLFFCKGCYWGIEMQPASKELLQLEGNSSTSSIEFSLLVCDKKTSASQNGQGLADKKPVIGEVPKSQVLGKVRDFLGSFSESTNKLQAEARHNPENFDIEVLDGNESQVIEMDLMLGIADLHTPEAIAAAEAAVSSYQPVLPLFGSGSETDTEESSSDDDGDILEENDGRKKMDLPSASGGSKPGEDVSCEITKRVSKKRPRILEL
ncbi:hypothetical protein SAY87_018739 [Trapa incisa]|uniref:Uncharacterized protein n=1 Tax=Trapa incisa TaxID=236973 RepID=A0AAN7JY31_9MYRT|nr:hypothetical protein SAY87_018739 [Trapa incisa]